LHVANGYFLLTSKQPDLPNRHINKTTTFDHKRRYKQYSYRLYLWVCLYILDLNSMKSYTFKISRHQSTYI